MEAAFTLEYVVDELSQCWYYDKFLTLSLIARRDKSWRRIRLEICSGPVSIQNRLVNSTPSVMATEATASNSQKGSEDPSTGRFEPTGEDEDDGFGPGTLMVLAAMNRGATRESEPVPTLSKIWQAILGELRDKFSSWGLGLAQP